MQIPSIPDYNSISFSGSVINRVNDDRVFGPVLEYGTTTIPILAAFDFIVKTEWGKMYNFPLVNKLQHLISDDNIDYQSFHSLN